MNFQFAIEQRLVLQLCPSSICRVLLRFLLSASNNIEQVSNEFPMKQRKFISKSSKFAGAMNVSRASHSTAVYCGRLQWSNKNAVPIS